MYQGAGVLAFHRGESRLEVLLGLRAGSAVSLFGAMRVAAAPYEPFLKRIVKAPLRALNRGRWSILGGGAERGESPLAAAARELEEEAGLPPGIASRQELESRLSVFAPHRVRLVGFVWTTYFLELPQKPRDWPIRRGGEWTECRWVSAPDLPDPAHWFLPATVRSLLRALRSP